MDCSVGAASSRTCMRGVPYWVRRHRWALILQQLGDCYCKGKYSLPKDAKAAKKWYAKVATSEYLHMSQSSVDTVAERLRELSE